MFSHDWKNSCKRIESYIIPHQPPRNLIYPSPTSSKTTSSTASFHTKKYLHSALPRHTQPPSHKNVQEHPNALHHSYKHPPTLNLPLRIPSQHEHQQLPPIQLHHNPSNPPPSLSPHGTPNHRTQSRYALGLYFSVSGGIEMFVVLEREGGDWSG